jgi:hypothetical protein
MSTRLRAVSIAAAVTVVLGVAAPAGASLALPPNANVRGHSLLEWERMFMEWLLTSATNPLFTGACGEVVDGVYFAPVAVSDDTRVECDVPVGAPILLAPSGGFSEIPTWGATDEAVIADVLSVWETLSASAVTVNGEEVSLAGAERFAGVYDIGPVEEGSFYDVVCAELTPPCVVDFEPGDTIRLATVAELVILHPLPPGDYTVVLTAAFSPTGPGPFKITLELHVG